MSRYGSFRDRLLFCVRFLGFVWIDRQADHIRFIDCNPPCHFRPGHPPFHGGKHLYPQPLIPHQPCRHRKELRLIHGAAGQHGADRVGCLLLGQVLGLPPVGFLPGYPGARVFLRGLTRPPVGFFPHPGGELFSHLPVKGGVPGAYPAIPLRNAAALQYPLSEQALGDRGLCLHDLLDFC